MTVTEAIGRRSSVRAFIPRTVDPSVVREILEKARRAPSGGNLQPWQVYAVAGDTLQAIKREVQARFASGVTEATEYSMYPPCLWEPLRARRQDAARLRYAAIGYGGKDPEAMREMVVRNYDFFGAPVGLFFFMDRRVGPPQWADTGMYMQNVMLLAEERGLATCPQEIWSNYHRTVSTLLQAPDSSFLFSGMSLGYPDTTHPLANVRTTRAELDEFAMFLGL